MKNLFPVLFLIMLGHWSFSQTPIPQLTVFANGFSRPLDLAHCNDDRIFIVEQRGKIWVLDKNGIKMPTPFLDIESKVYDTGNEQGLLGLAFQPDYKQSGAFYVNYTFGNGDTRVSRFFASPLDSNLADANSEQVLFEVDQPYSNHNGGCLKFGPDGYLYIGLGDGGSGGDPQGNGQKRTTFLAKMLRLDVSNSNTYTVPADNPFVNDPNTLDEIWALGVRNPWRYSFDRANGNLWIGDVGQDNWEEIDFQPANSIGGQNYGWSKMEGTHCYPPSSSNCDTTGITLPVAEYENSGSMGCSVTGGFVYRGFNYPNLYGRYLYTDYCTGRLWSVTYDASSMAWVNEQIADLLNNQLVSFGENKNGELFAMGLGNGNIYRLEDTVEKWEYTVNATPSLCPGMSNGSIEISFSANTPNPTVTWSDGFVGSLRTGLPEGTYTATILGTNGSIAKETIVLAPSISLEAAVTNATCPGSVDGEIDLTLNGTTSPPTSTVWNDGSADFDRTGLPAGNYSVSVTSAEGCMFSQDFTVDEQFDAPTPNITQLGFVLTVDGAYANYQWLRNGIVIDGETSISFDVFATNISEGTYSVVVTDANGCTGVSNGIFVEWTATENIIPELKSVKLTPNPFHQSLQLEITVSEPVYLEMFINDLQGKNFLKEEIAVASTTVRIFDLGQIPTGTYLLILKNKKGEWVERLVKL